MTAHCQYCSISFNSTGTVTRDRVVEILISTAFRIHCDIRLFFDHRSRSEIFLVSFSITLLIAAPVLSTRIENECIRNNKIDGTDWNDDSLLPTV